MQMLPASIRKRTVGTNTIGKRPYVRMQTHAFVCRLSYPGRPGVRQALRFLQNCSPLDAPCTSGAGADADA